MIDKSVPGDYATRYYPIIDIDDTGRHKVAMIPALSDAQLRCDKKPYLEEIVPHIFHLYGGDAIRAEISCPPLWTADGTLHRLQQSGCIPLQPLPVRRARL